MSEDTRTEIDEWIDDSTAVKNDTIKALIRVQNAIASLYNTTDARLTSATEDDLYDVRDTLIRIAYNALKRSDELIKKRDGEDKAK